jgi:hypothetical protein
VRKVLELFDWLQSKPYQDKVGSERSGKGYEQTYEAGTPAIERDHLDRKHRSNDENIRSKQLGYKWNAEDAPGDPVHPPSVRLSSQRENV